MTHTPDRCPRCRNPLVQLQDGTKCLICGGPRATEIGHPRYPLPEGQHPTYDTSTKLDKWLTEYNRTKKRRQYFRRRQRRAG